MKHKTLLLEQVDNLIKNYGKTHPDILRDLQSHRSAIANTFSKKDLVEAALKFADFFKIIYNIFIKD